MIYLRYADRFSITTSTAGELEYRLTLAPPYAVEYCDLLSSATTIDIEPNVIPPDGIGYVETITLRNVDASLDNKVTIHNEESSSHRMLLTTDITMFSTYVD